MDETQTAERDRELIEQLDPVTARRLFPDRFPQPLRVALRYPELTPETAASASAALDGAASCERAEDGSTVATFTLDHVEALHELFALVDGELGPQAVEVRINDQVLPMVRELWLPLLWTLRA